MTLDTRIRIPAVACVAAALWLAAAGVHAESPDGQWGPYPPYYGRPIFDTTGSARLVATPRNAEVYVDGYFVGVVDDYDGYFQRLHVEAGEHELQLYLEGHRTFTQKVLFVRGATLKVMHTMQPLGAGEASEPRPKADEAKRTQPYAGVAGQRSGAPPRGVPTPFGSLVLRVRPADATVLVDGETWTAAQGEDQFVIELAEGPHRVEVRKDGFRTYSTTVRVRRGETVRLNVSLTEAPAARRPEPAEGRGATVDVPYPFRSVRSLSFYRYI